MDTLALSYNHLPPHLRSCFLFVGVFPEDYDIPVTKLILLWIAQGFIRQNGDRILEDVAEDFVMDLIKRDLLIMTSEKRGDGQSKACRIHDLLRDLCLRKAHEEKISPETYRYGHVHASSSMEYRYMLLDHEPSLVCAIRLNWVVIFKWINHLIVKHMNPLRFRIWSLSLSPYFPLVSQHNNFYGIPQASLSKLVNLKMMIILSSKNVVVPKSIWDMVNLRHICIKAGENLLEEPCFVYVTQKDGCPSALGSLQTLSQVSPKSCHNIFSKTPNLRNLGFCGSLISSQGDLEFPDIRSLEHLQTLKLLNTIPFCELTRSCNPLMFPEKLKKLTLSNTGLDWEEMWTFAWIPNLEVLSLRVHACIGEKWDTSDSEFQRLKVLKLHDLDLRQWVSSSDSFPRLKRLEVRCCSNLESIPAGLGKILTLDMIEVIGCNSFAESSALEIKKEQELEGNYFLKVHASNNLSEKFHAPRMSMDR